MGSDPRLSLRLTWPQFSATRHKGYDAEQAGNAVAYTYARLWACYVWEPLLDLWGGATLSSGYRSKLLNVAVGGSPTSAHTEGRAGDVLPPKEMNIIDAFKRVLAAPEVRFDKAIIESDARATWIHLQIARTPGARRLAFMTFDRRNFVLFNPNDERIRALEEKDQ